MSGVPVRQILPNGQAVFSINKNETAYLYQEIFEQRIYLPPGGLSLPSSPVILDIGANIGIFSLFCKQEWNDAQIHAFEPVPDIYEVLRMNLDIVPGATAHNVGACDATYVTNMTYYPGFTVMSSLRADPQRDMAVARAYTMRQARYRYGERECSEIESSLDAVLRPRFASVSVPCRFTTLSALIRQTCCENVDLLKLDVEGSEAAALRGIDDEIWPSVRNVVAEVTDESGSLAEVQTQLSDHGLAIYVWQAQDYADTNQYIVHGCRDWR